METTLLIFWVCRTDRLVRAGFTDFLVCTSSEEQARKTHPSGHSDWDSHQWTTFAYTMEPMKNRSKDWVAPTQISSLQVQLVSTANPSQREGIIWANYWHK